MTRVAVLGLLALLAGCSVSRPLEDATGAEIYSMLCANCHGDDLEGGIGPPLGPRSNSAARPDSFLETTIEHGRGRMPSFSTSLSEEQLARLIDHIREVQEG
ncbi:MAG: cytochrome c [Actinobacteria bacterium]|nr:cytochrome c [Actinomycetota bacterium]